VPKFRSARDRAAFVVAEPDDRNANEAITDVVIGVVAVFNHAGNAFSGLSSFLGGQDGRRDECKAAAHHR